MKDKVLNFFVETRLYRRRWYALTFCIFVMGILGILCFFRDTESSRGTMLFLLISWPFIGLVSANVNVLALSRLVKANKKLEEKNGL